MIFLNLYLHREQPKFSPLGAQTVCNMKEERELLLLLLLSSLSLCCLRAASLMVKTSSAYAKVRAGATLAPL
jgi:hypothetical protein